MFFLNISQVQNKGSPGFFRLADAFGHPHEGASTPPRMTNDMFGFSFSTVKSIPEAYTPASLRNTAFFKNKNAEKPFGLSFSVFLPSESQAHKLNYTPARKCLVLGFQWLLNHVQIGFKKLGQYSSDILPIHHDRTIQQLIKIQLAGNVVFLK